MAERTPAQRYRDAVWSSKRLTPVQRVVALCYGEHAYGGDTAWVAQRRLLARTGIRSFATATAVVEWLVKSGWLEPSGRHPQHSQRVVYRLTVPDEDAGPEAHDQLRDEKGRYAKRETAPASGAVAVDIQNAQIAEPLQPVERSNRSSDGDEPLHSRMPNRSTGWSKPLHSTEQTAPASGARISTSPDDSLQEESGRDGASSADAATLRAASATERLEGPMTADEARESMRRLLAGVRRVKTSNWTAGTAPVGDPNPLYDPTLAATVAQAITDEQASQPVTADRLSARLAPQDPFTEEQAS